MITQIKKRDGEIVNYDSSKIVDAISRAAFEVGENILDEIGRASCRERV